MWQNQWEWGIKAPINIAVAMPEALDLQNAPQRTFTRTESDKHQMKNPVPKRHFHFCLQCPVQRGQAFLHTATGGSSCINKVIIHVVRAAIIQARFIHKHFLSYGGTACSVQLKHRHLFLCTPKLKPLFQQSALAHSAAENVCRGIN